MTAYRYRIRDWDNCFERAQSRKVDHLHWVGVPNKQHGMGLMKILSQTDGASIYGIWILIVGACSQQRAPRAGWLTADGTALGEPWTIEDLADRWRRKQEEISRALDVLASPKVGWIDAIDDDEVKTEAISTGSARLRRAPPPRTPDEVAADHRRELQKHLTRKRFASDGAALEEWVGLLKDDAGCQSLQEAIDCIHWFKVESRRRGINDRYAKGYEDLAREWQRKQAAPVREPEGAPS